MGVLIRTGWVTAAQLVTDSNESRRSGATRRLNDMGQPRDELGGRGDAGSIGFIVRCHCACGCTKPFYRGFSSYPLRLSSLLCADAVVSLVKVAEDASDKARQEQPDGEVGVDAGDHGEGSV